MKKISVLFVLGLFALFSLTACNPESVIPESVTPEVITSPEPDNPDVASGTRDIGDFIGEVLEIIGNEITLRVASVPAFGDMPNRDSMDREQFREERRARQAEGGTQWEYTGEVVDIVIGSDVPIVMMSRGSGGLQEQEASLSAIQVGSMLQISYSDDGQTIAKVVIAQTR